MPSKFNPRFHIAEDAVLGTRQSTRGEYWHLRFHWKEASTHKFFSLRLKYEEGFSNEKEAKKKAEEICNTARQSAKAGVDPSEKITPEYLREKYLEHIGELATKNDELTEKGELPIHLVEGGRGYWSIKRYKYAKHSIGRNAEEIRKKKINPFGIELFMQEKLPKKLNKVKQRHLEEFGIWATEKYGWAPSTVNHALIQLRMIWRYAHNKGYVEFIPTLSQRPAQLVERTRRKITPEEYSKIVEVSRNRYLNLLEKKEPLTNKEKRNIDLHYQFHMWILIMSNSGIRPPSGIEERLLIKWSDIHERDNGKERFLLRRSEKAHLNYEAVILPNAHEYLDALKALQKMRGIKTDFVFAHTFDNVASGGKGWEKGDPIKSFKRQWATCLKEAGLNMPPGTPQRSNLVPYSLRAWFMTNRLESSDTLRLEDLAKATGSSPEIIAKLYYDYNTRKRYDELSQGILDRSRLEAIYRDGMYIGRQEIE